MGRAESATGSSASKGSGNGMDVPCPGLRLPGVKQRNLLRSHCCHRLPATDCASAGTKRDGADPRQAVGIADITGGQVGQYRLIQPRHNTVQLYAGVHPGSARCAVGGCRCQSARLTQAPASRTLGLTSPASQLNQGPSPREACR